MSNPTVWFVPYLDGDWLGYGPLDAALNYGLLPPNQKEITDNMKVAVGFWKKQTGGKVVFGAHSGTYCREAFYCEPMYEHYRALAANGGELAVHPHEERVKSGHAIEDLDHMRFVISWKQRLLTEAGVKPTTLRIPYNGYVPGLTQIAEENELLIDLSSAPGFAKELWRSDWRGAPTSAYFLDHADHRKAPTAGGARSRVLEVPLAWDGQRTGVRNYLFNENIELDGLKAVWDAVVERARREGPQMVYFLSHLHSMADDELRERCARMLDHAIVHHGIPVTPSEAYKVYREKMAATLH